MLNELARLAIANLFDLGNYDLAGSIRTSISQNFVHWVDDLLPCACHEGEKTKSFHFAQLKDPRKEKNLVNKTSPRRLKFNANGI